MASRLFSAQPAAGGTASRGAHQWPAVHRPPRLGQRGKPDTTNCPSAQNRFQSPAGDNVRARGYQACTGTASDHHRDTWFLARRSGNLKGPTGTRSPRPGFDQLLTSSTQPASLAGDRRRRRSARRPRRRPALLTSDRPRGGESPSQNSNLFFDVFQQIAGGGTLANEQRGDERLKHCWSQVRVAEGEDLQPAPHPTPHFVVQNGLLYCVAQRRGEEKTLLVVPRSKVQTVLELAHAHPMAGHLGAQNTAQRIRDRFHWPGLEGDVKRYCQACPTCQRTSPHTPPPSPLIPLPIIEVPFERIGMDLVGPLPKSARGHEHILVIVDYATRYPEAIPLRKATAKNIAQELFLLSSRVGLPAEILTDQGTPFMSRIMADLCKLLKVRQIRTSVYHPQTDGLVERFNKTLKQMLRRVVAEDQRDWDQMIPYVLFGIREVPQASTGFTPPGFSTRFSRDGAVMMISGTAGLLNDEGGGDDEDDDESVLRDSTVEIKKQKHD
uniref:Gypsy retrotransposon integrase-like protein 1 n=1 Tax=Cyprinus carpio carpio TaxID=630221 RepID=A0A9J8BEK1_CYPCA